MTWTIEENSVFISVGSRLALEQESFVSAVEALLLKRGLRPVTLGRNVPSNGTPLNTIRAIVSSTQGTLVIAFVRFRIMSALEHPLSSTPVIVTDRNLPTVWNQIEAAMAYQAGKPLLILSEQGLYPEGIIDRAVYPSITFTVPSEHESLPRRLEEDLNQWIAGLHTS